MSPHLFLIYNLVISFFPSLSLLLRWELINLVHLKIKFAFVLLSTYCFSPLFYGFNALCLSF